MGSTSQCKEYTSEFYGVQIETCRTTHQLESLTQGGSLKVVEYLEGETMQRRAQRGKTNFQEFCETLPRGH
jgi:hypothetical protein